MATTANIRVNPDRSLVDVDIRADGTPAEDFGDVFAGDGNMWPDNDCIIIETDEVKYLAVLEGAGLGIEENTVYAISTTDHGYVLTPLATEVEEVDDEVFDE